MLLGQHVAGQFQMSNDGGGHTLVTDPPVSSSDPTHVAWRTRSTKADFGTIDPDYPTRSWTGN